MTPGVARDRLAAIVLLAAAATAACAGGIRVGPPVSDPAGVASEARSAAGPDHSSLVRFTWSYADDQGSVEGEGVGRYTPRDSFRVDLFSSGDVGLAAALVDGRLSTSGEVEGVELPGPAFMYAMAGIFHPASGTLQSAHETDRGRLLVYSVDAGERRYLVSEGRLHRLEERRRGELARRVVVEWDSASTWPTSAEFRDDEAPRRVRWTLVEAGRAEGGFDADIYELPTRP